MFSSYAPFTPEGYVSLDAALVVVFAVAMHDASAWESPDTSSGWGFRMVERPPSHALRRMAHALYPGIAVTATGSDGNPKRIFLRPPLRDIWPEHREYFCTEEIAETAYIVRRALSAGQLQSFVIGVDGDMMPLPARFWNTEGAEALFTAEATIAFETERGSCGPDGVFLLVDKLDAWLAILFDSYDPPGRPGASGKTDPVQACVAWLSDMMKRSPTSSPPKQQLWDEAKAQFKELSWRAFLTAWRAARANHPTATGWGHAGRKRKIRSNPERNPEQNN
jgi:hypothetical protein